MPFTELCIYQVKPQKVDEFEALMLEAKEFLEKQKGLLLLRFVKREYHIDMEQIKEGLPPPLRFQRPQNILITMEGMQ